MMVILSPIPYPIKQTIACLAESISNLLAATKLAHYILPLGDRILSDRLLMGYDIVLLTNCLD